MQRPQRKAIYNEHAELGKIMQSLLGHMYDFILKAWETVKVFSGGGELSVSCKQSYGLKRLLWSQWENELEGGQ